MLVYRRLQNVCNRKVKSEEATAFLIWMILLFSVVRLTTISEQSEPRFCFSVAYILRSPVDVEVKGHIVHVKPNEISLAVKNYRRAS